MKIRVLKGTDEIGGSCIEISTPNTTILLDYGTPLQEKSQKVTLEQKIDAILISHPHQDHFGEIINLDSKIPVYCGELSSKLMDATKIFTGNEKLSNNFHHFVAWQKFTIGDFTITPYLVDHSATDAYAFLIEAESQKILYSGDFRANGRKAKLFYKMIEDKNLKNIDVLMMEGTMMQRSNLDFPDEQSVENKIYEVLTSNENLSFLIGSSQNIDSIVSAYRACKKANKIFVVDIYTAWILEVVSQKSKVPNISWDDVKVIKKFGGRYYEKIKTDREHFGDFVNRVFDDVVTLEELENNPSKYLLKITPWVIETLLEKTNLQNANIIYSQWLGYLKEEFSESKTVALLENLQTKYNWHYAHTSGHADLKSLQTFASSLSPKKLIPIHTEHKEEFVEHFENVVILEDNEMYEVGQSLSEFQVNEMNELFKDDFLKEDEMDSYDLQYFRMAKELNVKFYERLKKNNLHCRGSLNSISLISLDSKTPERGVSNIKKEEKFLEILNKIESNSLVIEEPARNTPEKLLQATIISQAIFQNKHYLPFGEKISFITSEFALKSNELKVVNDILGFSEDGAIYVIELKSSRFKTELEKQVVIFENFIRSHTELFSDLLDIYDFKWNGIIKKAVVWPKASSLSKKVFDNKIEEFVYDKALLENKGVLAVEELKYDN